MYNGYGPEVSVSEFGWLHCDHSGETSIRRRTISNGTKRVCRQCCTCGSDLGAIGKNSHTVMSLATIEDFDEMIQQLWRDQCALFREEKEQRQADERNALQLQRRQEYIEYITSDTWKRKRAMVLDHAGDLCEGCGVNRAVHVHHLTYDHLGDEFLWELKAVCLRCHQKAHPEKDMRHD